MGEIKLRSWTTTTQRMDYGIRLNRDTELLDVPTINWMQYTGVDETDTGREIYQGDILDYDDGQCFPVERVHRMRGIVELTPVGWLIRDRDKSNSVPLWDETAEIKIVGNVFENPELGFDL